jgi:hypothetical protein
MRLILLAAVAALSAGAAHAQFKPFKPVVEPKPRVWTPPAEAPAVHPPRQQTGPQGFEPFKPVKPFRGVNVDTDSSGLYPELHPKHRRAPRAGDPIF